jgi:hypothetical protein
VLAGRLGVCMHTCATRRADASVSWNQNLNGSTDVIVYCKFGVAAEIQHNVPVQALSYVSGSRQEALLSRSSLANELLIVKKVWHL